jgi:NADP-dependent 3-hydroxy acid dehydrogenase YdfG
MSQIKGKVVAITGASSGMGEATAIELAGRGAMVVLGARRSVRLESLAARIAQSGGRAVWLRVDVRRPEDLAALVALARAEFGKLDVLINNAGIGPIGPLDDLRADDWNDMIEVNLKGTLNGIAAALPVFRTQGFGQFVNVVSTAGLTVVPNMGVYAATKNAVRTLTEGLRQEAGPHLRVALISPGYVRTDFADSMTDLAMRAATREGMDTMAIPPEAIARSIAFVIEQPPEVDVGEIVIRPTAQA